MAYNKHAKDAPGTIVIIAVICLIIAGICKIFGI